MVEAEYLYLHFDLKDWLKDFLVVVNKIPYMENFEEGKADSEEKLDLKWYYCLEYLHFEKKFDLVDIVLELLDFHDPY